jgi:predicted nucleic acid-binding protein
MNVTVIVIAVVILVLLVIGAMYFAQRQRRRQELREQFGPEYDRAVDTYGEPAKAERALEARAERVAALHIRPLSAEDSQRYGERWRQVQAHFVDDPETAIDDADELCGEVMLARGYPVGDFEQRAADISVDHPHVVEHYRAAHAVATDPDAGTEDMRQAMVHYRTLFEDLIDSREAIRR